MRQRYAIFCLLLLLSFNLRAHSGNSSIEFVENKGQWQGPFIYKAKTSNGDIYLQKNGFSFVVGASSNADMLYAFKHNIIKQAPILKFHAYRVIFEGAMEPQVTGTKEQSHYYSYFLGSNPRNWKSGIHPNLAVDYTRLYDGVDMHIASENGLLKYDLIVAPGTDVNQIKLRYEGVNGLEIKDGNLMVQTSVGDVQEMPPYAYQYIDGNRKEVSCKYKLKDNILTYAFPKGYDASYPLVIDPTVVFSRLTGSSADNWGYTATYDNAGNFYAGGVVNSEGTYPTTTGAFDVTHNGPSGDLGWDIGITKYNPTGTIVYSTYIGGSLQDYPHSMIVDNGGNLIIAGKTFSLNYPTKDGIKNSPRTGSDADIIVTKLNAAGTALVNSTYIGGSDDDGINISANLSTMGSLKYSYGDDARSEVIVDNAGYIYLASSTKSNDFPKANSTVNHAGAQDGVVLKMEMNGGPMALIWSTYLGGTGDDAAYVLALDQSQTHVFVAGGVTGSALPSGATSGTLNPNSLGGIDGFVARFLNSGSYPMEKATYIGTSAYDQVFGVQVDLEDSVYVMGNTLGNFPIQKAAVAPSIYSNTGAPQFIMKLDKDLSKNIFSTRFGTSASEINITPVAFLVDTCQNIYISGWGGTIAKANSSTVGMPTTAQPAGNILSNATDGNDFYFIAFSKNAIALQYAGFLGRNLPFGGEHVDGGTSRFDRNGVIYQAICGECGPGTPAFPITTGPTKPNGTNCNLASVKIEFNLGAVNVGLKVEPDAVLCLDQTVQFQNLSTNAASYEWNFGDGTTSNQQVPPPKSYNAVGKYTVRLIGINPNACKVRDTAYLSVTVDTATLKANFTATITKTCDPYEVSLVNNTTFSKPPAAASTYLWDFGDGSTSSARDPQPHSYNDTGSYTIRLIVIDTNYCNAPDTFTQTVQFSNFDVKAEFPLPSACVSQGVTFGNNSTNATGYLWYFGDGDTSSAAVPTHLYSSAGTYRVVLYALHPGACNKMDSVVQMLTIRPAPTADFVHAPIIAERNVPTTFTNKSVGATSYEWNFGDNTGSQEQDPVHYYKKTGKYTVCLVAKNSESCADTICKEGIDADVLPLVDIPTGFSPNGDGQNDVLYVRGAAIEKFTLKIYNRWGEKVFEVTAPEANTPKYGWNGDHKGKQQEVEAYAYILSGSFVDGTGFYKKGNVTLLR